MAFALDLIVGSTTHSLTDGNPYRLVSATGLGMPPVMRFARRYPQQDGYDDLGHVLEPRMITLAVEFAAPTAAILDERRDNLTRLFVPGSNMPLVLQVTREDGAVRRLDVVATGLSGIDLEPDTRAARLHKVVIQLRAADPIWYSPTTGTVALTTIDVSDWWLAGGQIPAGDVLEASTNIGFAQRWNWGTATQRPILGEYRLTIAFRGTIDSIPSIERYIWAAYTEPPSGGWLFGIYPDASPYPPGLRNQLFIGHNYTGGIWAVLGNYVGELRSVVVSLGRGFWQVWVDNHSVGYGNHTLGTSALRIVDPKGVWNYSLSGTTPMPMSHAAVYTDYVDGTRARALANAMAGTIVDFAMSGTVAYNGDYDDYPQITLTGPLGDPVVTNITTGRKIDFTGSTIPAGVTYTIDLSAEALTVIDSGGTIRMDQLSPDSDIGNWFLAGNVTNLVTVASTTSGSTSAAQIVYRNRYVSY